MHVPEGASVLVIDGSKALFLRNEGDSEFPDLRLISKWEQDVPQDRDLRSDAPGRTFGSHDGGARRSSYDEGDLHEQAEIEFTSKIGRFLNEQAELHSMGELIIIAPPRTLGELRKELGREASARLTAEIAKDLVKHPIAEIEHLLAAEPE